MEVRKFEALSMQDAVKLVKKELGSDAVILSTTQRKGSSSKGEPQHTIYEITATPSAQRTESPTPQKTISKYQFPRVDTREPATVVKGAPSPVITPKMVAKTSSNSSEAIPSPEISELKSELLRVRREIESLPHVNVTEQVQEIKVLLHDLMRDRMVKDSAALPTSLTDLQVKMRASGVKESVSQWLVSQLKALELPKNEDGSHYSAEQIRSFYLNYAVRYLYKKIQVTGPWRQTPGKQEIICFVGPTGVGKTTTTAKIAAKMMLEEKKKVALISMDSMRVAASDQLRVYSRILECPFYDASDATQLASHIVKLKDRDYILIDTAGRSFRSSDQLAQLRELQQLDLPIQFHIVLSCTMKQRDLEEYFKAYQFLTPKSAVFTKLDESWAYGEILNSAVTSNVPLSFFSTGQNVPADLEYATKERVVEKIFGI